MHDIAVNLLASVLAGTGVWLVQRVLGYRRLARKRAFFGLAAGGECALVVSKHAASPSDQSVHRRDVAGLVELASIAKDCGAQADMVTDYDAVQGVGRRTEFCVGGPHGNPRTAAHLRAFLHGVRIPTGPSPEGPARDELPITIGSTTYRRTPGQEEFVVLARAYGPANAGWKPAAWSASLASLGRGRPTMAHPVFVLAGQTAQTNHAAARYLARRYRELLRRYGTRTNFCLVLRVLEPTTYGSDLVEVAADVTGVAFTTATAAEADS